MGLREREALRVAGAFGAGMGCMGRTCGAVTGAVMVIGLAASKTAPGEDDRKMVGYGLVREFTRRFEAQHKTVECRALLGVDLGTEAGMAAAVDAGLFTTRCARFVEEAVALLEDILP